MALLTGPAALQCRLGGALRPLTATRCQAESISQTPTVRRLPYVVRFFSIQGPSARGGTYGSLALATITHVSSRSGWSVTRAMPGSLYGPAILILLWVNTHRLSWGQGCGECEEIGQQEWRCTKHKWPRP